MPVFPRSTRALSRYATIPRFPEAMQSWGQSGKGQLRATVSLGREWKEIYPILDTSLPSVRALIAAINQSLREGTLWDVQHPYFNRRVGDPGAPGTPLVSGGGQTGSSLLIDGFWVNSCSAPIAIDQAPWSSSSSPIVTPAASVAPDGTLTGVRIEDDNAASSEWRQFTVTVANDTATHVAGVYVRKRALAGVYAAIEVAYSGGTGVSFAGVINPETGECNAGASVIDVDADWWFLWLAAANNGLGNTTLTLRLRPAFNSTGSTSAQVASVGATHYWGARVELNKSTPTLPVKPWLYAGEMIHVAGAPVILDVAATVVLLGASHTLAIHPPIFVGQSPADNAVITTDPTAFYFKAHLIAVDEMPDIDSTGYIEAGLTLHWREQPG